jgi:hypothetical protein
MIVARNAKVTVTFIAFIIWYCSNSSPLPILNQRRPHPLRGKRHLAQAYACAPLASKIALATAGAVVTVAGSPATSAGTNEIAPKNFATCICLVSHA